MVHFSKLKLYGFKSFVDKTELEIGSGLNGIVGPNGCGKSNLVEALRWVMGEKSAKNMRGGGMEDVIFAGTSKRPARNLAEVTVIMNNEDGSAPAPFNASTEIEINRRIERDKGSQYRVNGKAVRARDVNLLFADTATGANSPALVSQGRITEIITAKPTDRRKILEDSAGVSGLHTRRHEAELRLKAAESNLTRLDDVLKEMRSRLSSLKRQARQAERYKDINDQIRRMDMALSWSEWQSIHTKIKNERDCFARHNDDVQSALSVTKNLTTQIEAIESDLPDLRKNHLEAQAVLQNFRVSLERLEQDIQSRAKGYQDAIETREQINRDSAFTQSQFDQLIQNMNDAENQLEQTTLNGQNIPEKIETAVQTVADIKSHYDDLITTRQQLETQVAVATDNRHSLQKQIEDTQERLEKINHNITTLNDSITETDHKITSIKNDDDFTVDLDALETQITKQSADIEKVKNEQAEATEQYDGLKSLYDDNHAALQTLNGEISALCTLIESYNNNDNEMIPDEDVALINQLNVENGYEKALTTALGQWASLAGTDQNAMVYWNDDEDISNMNISTPQGTQPLSHYVEAPSSLSRLLTATGVVETLPSSAHLTAGQMIVAMDGSFIRWDGLHVKAEATQASDQTHLLLEQKNRLIKLQADQEAQQVALETITADVKNAHTAKDTLSDKLVSFKNILASLEHDLNNKKHAQSRLKDQLLSLEDRMKDYQDRLLQNTKEKQDLDNNRLSLESQFDAGNDQAITEKQNQIEHFNHQITDVKDTLDNAHRTLLQHQQAQSDYDRTLERLKNDIERYHREKEGLNSRLEEFSDRADAIDAKIATYKTSSDDDADATRENLLTKIASQTETLTSLATTLEEQENNYRTLQSQLREEEAKATTAREDRARVQANVANAENDLKRVQETITEKFDLSPQALEEKTYSLFDNNIPDSQTLHNDKDTLTRQRDGIGPVNLRAAIESEETETQLAEMEAEYTDLTKAIEQLRTGIAKLNREAKERLAIAFKRVDTHFQRLFAQLFEGGKAYLEMIESDDPMEGGLEIYAQPPGKSLQKLSLLSGGEQTLTATALIFAMFLTNPSPICVLDEIDAPLDDANVDRVCTLMENIARDTDTRFIVITHHRMTMARMDRLYGVTMSERGVSQLVSVNMALQGEMELEQSA